MALAKKTTKTQKAKIEKRAEKVGEFVGKRRPFAGTAMLFFALIFIVAFIDYAPGQDIFFRESVFKDFMLSTHPTSANICGRVGATFSMLAINLIGAGTWWLLVYLVLMGVLCFQRRANPFAIPSLLAMLASIVIASTAAAMLEVFNNGHISAAAYYTAGWGGHIGSFLYMELLYPSLRFFGSLLLLTVLYAFCMIVVFAANPAILADELADNLRKTPSFLGKFLKVLLALFLFFPKLFLKLFKKKDAHEDADPVDGFVAEIPRKKEKKNTEDEEFNQTDEDEIRDFLETAAVDFEEDIKEEAPEDFKPNVVSFEAKPAKAEPAQEATYEPAAKGFKISHLEDEKYMPTGLKKAKGDYVFPTIDLLAQQPAENESSVENYQDRMDHIIETLLTFGIGVTPAEAVVGPVITRYEVRPNAGVRINKISGLENDIALGLKVQKVRVTVTDRGTIGIEVPNKVRKNVSMRDIIESKEWNESKAEIPVVMGKDVTGKPVVLNLSKMPHALIAGSTGSGKSVCINVIVASLLYHSTPEDLRFIMVDPKMVELQVYNTLPHMLVPVVTDPRKVPAAFKWLITEMMKRFAIFQKVGVRNIAGFNAKLLKDKEEQEKAAEMDAAMTPEERAMSLDNNPEVDEVSEEAEIPEKKLPYIVCIIDELADLMMVAGKEVENSIARLAQLGRAAGIHLLVATQRPSADVITGLIKANLPTRIGFKVASFIDSRTILDSKGAETLIGWGDMLFIPPGSSELIRAQGAFISDDEINSIVEALKANGEPEFEQEMQEQLDSAGEDSDMDDENGEAGQWSDPLAPKAIAIIKESQRASISHLQRKLRIGYNRAASIMDELEEKGMVGPDNGPSNPREILM